MNIREEYSRLCTFSASKQKWQEIEDLWLVASNYEKIGKDWLKKADSAGENVTSFAIDLNTWKYVVGAKGRSHYEPKLQLIATLAREELKSWSQIEYRVVEGRMAHVESWKYPLITFMGMWVFGDLDLLKALEEKMLELEIGLPATSLKKKFL